MKTKTKKAVSTKEKKSPSLGLDPDKLHFLPLGGAGHFGANLNLYIFQNKILAVDLGMGFNDLDLPGIDLTVPDISFLRKHKDKLLGIVATHAHEDHIGGIHHVWRSLECPVFATPFTATVLKKKFSEVGLQKKAVITQLKINERFDIGPFNVELITVAHSIPEPNALAIRVKNYDAVLHTGDWKLDPDPVVGKATDAKHIQKIGNEGVLAIVGDSTNAHIDGHSKSEKDVQNSFVSLFKKCKKRIAVVCFSSNIARIESIAYAAKKNGRSVALAGRSLWRMVDSAKENGFLSSVDKFLSPEEASYLNPEQIVYICTGSQGEARAALAKIVNNEHPEALLEYGDHVIFSSRAIPGNEKAIFALKNALLKRGVHVVDDYEGGPIHVSGHPYREELMLLYQWAKPKLALPVHGEFFMQHAQENIAKACNVPHSLIPTNGDLIEIEQDGRAQIVERILVQEMVVDGEMVKSIDDEALVNRKRLNVAGTATVTVVVDRRGRLVADPFVSSFGVIDGHTEENILYEDIEDAVADAVEKCINDDDKIAFAARSVVRRYFSKISGKKPMTHVHFVRLEN